MKKLNLNWNGVPDTTGYLFSFAKSLMCALQNSRFSAFSEDIIAASGFAFRMWVDEKELCPSAASTWDFDRQKEWVENSGLVCEYAGRYWQQEEREEEERVKAVHLIKASIDKGTAAVVWDVSGCEWGLITGYDEDVRQFSSLQIQGTEDTLSYSDLGKLEIPILSVLTITDGKEKDAELLYNDTLRLAVGHLRGKEWSENAGGLAAYDTLLSFLKTRFCSDFSWNLEYCLGTYAALKYYAWKFFDKYGSLELAALYLEIYSAWKDAFACKKEKDATSDSVKNNITELLWTAYTLEKKACGKMEDTLAEIDS